ncbi:MAG: hypothetical protein DI528_22250 [Shinella sp.]|nr:MAG: hypothetical protein DI528_22250 [Shinella sp.]
MALPSVHVICGFAGNDIGDNPSRSKAALFCDPQWSEEPASGTATTHVAPDTAGLRPVFRITNEVDIRAVHGANPSIANGPVHVLRAKDGPHDLYVKPGDKFVWEAA